MRGCGPLLPNRRHPEAIRVLPQHQRFWANCLARLAFSANLPSPGETRRACWATVAVCRAFGSWDKVAWDCSLITRNRALESPGRACKYADVVLMLAWPS